MTETIRYAAGESSLGAFLAAASADGLVMVAFADTGETATLSYALNGTVAGLKRMPGRMKRDVFQGIRSPHQMTSVQAMMTLNRRSNPAMAHVVSGRRSAARRSFRRRLPRPRSAVAWEFSRIPQQSTKRHETRELVMGQFEFLIRR